MVWKTTWLRPWSPEELPPWSPEELPPPLRRLLLLGDRPDGAPPYRVVGNPVKLSRTGEGPFRRFPRLGEHTAEVLHEELGLEQAVIDDLARRRVIDLGGPRDPLPDEP